MPVNTQSTSSVDSPAQRIVVKSVNGHEPVKPEPSTASDASPLAAAHTNAGASTSASRHATSQLQTPHSSPTKSSAAASPTKSPGRPRRVEPVLVSSADFGPSAGDDSENEAAAQVDAPKMQGMKRTDRKSKTEAMNALAGKDGQQDDAVSSSSSVRHETAAISASPSHHPVRKMTVAQSFPPLVFDRTAPSGSSSSRSEPAIPTSASTPRRPAPRLRPRLFELEEAPIFYPTLEEFEDPMKYISWVAHPHGGNGKASGIVKIVPPEGWNPECVLDEQTFRFRTRVQRLNSLSADARASQNYQEQLQKFHAQQGRKRVSVPRIDGRLVDLYQLKLVIASFGGYDAVCRGRKWSDATRKLGYAEKDCSQLSTQVKAAYSRIIWPFEEFMSQVREQTRPAGSSASSVSPSVAQGAVMAGLSSGSELLETAKRISMSPGLDSTGAGDRLTASGTPEPSASQTAELIASNGGDPSSQSPSVGASTRRSTRKRSEVNATGSSSRSGLGTASAVSVASPATPVSARRTRKGVSPHGDSDTQHRSSAAVAHGTEEQMCEICLRGEDGLNMLLCDECNRGYHMYCLQPPLTAIPKSQWFCPPCLVGTGHDFGFDDGETHSLYTFWQRAEAFKRSWWSSHPDRIWKPEESQELESARKTDAAHGPCINGLARNIAGTDLIVSEDDVEREFWRLVHSQEEEVEVEYGADVHSTTHGSALPTQETHPLSVYSRDRWNLNNLPILPGSLLQYIKSDISGMTVPWIYVGMIFSTFCWHNEDHYTYSINYQHWGETKTWYGIPGEDAERFEEAMRRAAPDLFETLPDLLFHLTTMMSPEKLRKEGVRVYACDQRANEFVITFPKAYHSGFNHGLNLNEAVNFALPDWISDDLESTRRYQRFRKPAVFSHDQLLITVSQQSQTIETAVWLEAAMQEMVDREIAKRQALREIIPDLNEEVYDEDVVESKYQCEHCTIFCYLGQLTSPKSHGVACLDHGFEVCNADAPVKWTLRLRFSDEQLRTILAKVSEKAAIPRNWTQRLKKTLALNASPPLKTLRSLLHEGEKISFPLEPLEDLRAFVNCANSWIERANVFLTRKVHKRRSEVGAAITITGRGRRSVAAAAASADDSPARRTSIDVTAEDGDGASDRSPEALTSLLKELETLHFDAPEIASLQTVSQELEDFLSRCEDILRHSREDSGKEPSLKDCENALTLGSSLNVDAPQIKELSDYVERRKWIEEVEEAQSGYLYHHEVTELLDRADQCGLQEHELRTDLEKRRTEGDAWTERARSALSGQLAGTVELLEELSESSSDVAVVIEVAQDVSNLLSKAKDLQKTVQSIYKTVSSGPPGAPTASDADGDMSMVSVSENMDAASRIALLPEARRALRAIRSNKLAIEHVDELEAAIAVFDAWKSDFNNILQTLASSKARLSDTDRATELDKIVARVEDTTDPHDDQTRSKSRKCVCRSSAPVSVPSREAAVCVRCQIPYHLACIKVRPIEVTRAAGEWVCPICCYSKSSSLLKQRRAVDLAMLARLVHDEGHRRDQLLFLPLEWDAVEEMVAKVRRFETACRRMLKGVPQLQDEPKQATLAHWLRRTLGCPIDAQAGDSETVLTRISDLVISMHAESEAAIDARPDDSIDADISMTSEVTTTPSRLPPGSTKPAAKFEAKASTTGSGSASASATPATTPAMRDDRKRKAKRGKRAKLVFREEIGIGAFRDGQAIYCLCHEPESGRMIACDKCMLWFHIHCVRLGDPPNLGDEPWICPMCCIKAERKYPQAEVRVKEMGVTDPDLWLDIRATLRSLEKPVSKVQMWSSPEDKRIILHLEKFQPAIHAEEVHATNASKRARLDTEPAVKSRASLGRADSAGESVAAASATPPVASEPTRAARKSGGAAKGSAASAPKIAPAASEITTAAGSTSGSVKAAGVAPHAGGESKAGTPPRGDDKPSAASLEMAAWSQAQQRRNAEGMENLRRRGVTDAMLLRHYVAWNGRTLIHPVRDAYGAIVEVPLGEHIRLHADDPQGARLIHNAIEIFNDQYDDHGRPPLSRSYHGADGGDGPTAAMPRYRHGDARYEDARLRSAQDSAAGRYDGYMADVSPGSALGPTAPSRMTADRDRDASFRSIPPLPASAARSPTPRSNGIRESIPTFARPSGMNGSGSNSSISGALPMAPPSPHGGKHPSAFGPPAISPRPHAAYASASMGQPHRMPVTPVVPSSSPALPSHGVAASYRVSAPAIDPALATPSPAPTHKDIKSPALKGNSAASRAAGDPDKGRGKTETSNNEEEIQARRMARRMRPNASDAEIEEMVRAFLSTEASDAASAA
ncbi:PLU-1-domain-containing protein [Testicularia cyperi]|uniref:PLU-1-domain-containing protein n=1 Tax=Testicularia cyperi TaxID=1882483 RepID=A0A317XX08_9BASI|nr:PLU-1-domain-containing protein [Testicularia cyperi]